MGRRVFYKEEVTGEVVTHHKFVYDNYLCVQKLDALNNNSQLNLFVWDPTESVESLVKKLRDEYNKQMKGKQ